MKESKTSKSYKWRKEKKKKKKGQKLIHRDYFKRLKSLDTATSWTAALQAPLSKRFSREELCSG